MTTVKPSHRLTLRDRLSRLSFDQACKLLGPEGRRLIQRGATYSVDLEHDLLFSDDRVSLVLRSFTDQGGVEVAIDHDSSHPRKLHGGCSQCDEPCEHLGALFSAILEHKQALGLAKAPPEPTALGSLSDEQLVEQAVSERRTRAREEPMRIEADDRDHAWCDYRVASRLSGKIYRVAFRGFDPGASYCTCPDFRTNTLGTCKHVLKVAAQVKRRFTPAQLKRGYKFNRLEVHLRYGRDVTLHLGAPANLAPEVDAVVQPLLNRALEVGELLAVLGRLQRAAIPYHVYPDAEEYIEQHLHRQRLRELVAEVRRDPAAHPLRTTLLRIPLLPYQMDGVAFAAGAGRAVLADDMGLGKTIQAVGVAELLAREAGISKVLVVAPASLKSQWREELWRFCGREAQLITGRAEERTAQYANDCFFTISNYEQVLRDIRFIERVGWDLIVLDEGQRIKNWEAKTTRVVKSLRSRFALVLSGTPLENRLDDLYSIVQFIDDRRLGPGFRFFNEHRLVDDRGRVLGYKQLDQLRQRLQPILLRRTRESVRLDLPERTIEIVRVTPTEAQQALHDAHLQIVAKIVRKKFLTEMDLLRLRAALLACRMTADASVLVDKLSVNCSSKLERLAELLDTLAAEPARKVIVFSEWTSMLDLIEPLLIQRGLNFVRLDGSVPQAQRQTLVNAFQTDPACRFFLTTNAGSTGLNLQAADTVINVDLPWNPAQLEQRIARAHRMGQTRPVQVYVLVTENTLEENLLGTLAAKKDLALAALDSESEVDTVELKTGSEALKARLEILLGARPAAEVEPVPAPVVASAPGSGNRVAAAGGELLGAVFGFLDALVGDAAPAAAPPEPLVMQLRARLAEQVVEDGSGTARLTFTLPNREALDGLAQTLARLLMVGGAGQTPLETASESRN